MPIPSSALTTLAPQLESFYEASFAALAEDYIGPRVLPVTAVTKQSGTFGVIPLEELLKAPEPLERASGSGYRRDTVRFTEASYATQEYGTEEIIDEREAAMYGDYMSAAEFATMRAAHKLLMASEARVAAIVADFAYYDNQASMKQAVTNGQWSTLATSTPVADVEAAVMKFYANTGMWPNTLIMNRQVFRTLRMNTQILNSVKSDGAGDQARLGDITTGQLSAVFDIPNILVAGGTKNTAAVGAAASVSQIWPKHVCVCRTAASSDMREPCIGRQFHWAEDGSSVSGRVETYRDERIRADIVRLRHEIMEKRIYNEMLVMIPSAIA